MGKMAEIVFDLDLFDEGTSAPKPIPQKKEKPRERIRILEDTPQVKRERSHIQERRNLRSTLAIISIALVLATVAGSFIYLGAYINNYDHKIAEVQAELDIAESQNIILNIKKDSMVSFDSVRQSAEEKGMIQRDRYQVTYFELTQEDYGVVNPGK